MKRNKKLFFFFIVLAGSHFLKQERTIIFNNLKINTFQSIFFFSLLFFNSFYFLFADNTSFYRFQMLCSIKESILSILFRFYYRHFHWFSWRVFEYKFLDCNIVEALRLARSNKDLLNIYFRVVIKIPLFRWAFRDGEQRR